MIASSGTKVSVIWTVNGVQHDRLEKLNWPEVQCSWDCMCRRRPDHKEISQ